MGLSVAVLITVYNRKDKTIKCLTNLFQQKLPKDVKIDVYLTNDGCTDGTPEAISLYFPQVHIINGDGTLFWNRGMYVAWNTASKIKDYDFYFWLNDDTVLFPDAMIQLLLDAKQKPNSIIVGTTCSSSDNSCVTYGGISEGKVVKPNGRIQKCQTFNGNIVLIPKIIFKNIGNLDWTYRHAMGDLDYGLRVIHSGYCNYISGGFVGICDRNSRPIPWTCPEVSFKNRWKNFHSPLAYGQPGSMFYFNRKNYGLLVAIRVWVSNHIRVLFPRLWK